MSAGGWRLALSAQAALAQAGWVGVRLMIGYRAVELGADALTLGLVAASSAVPALLGALPTGRLSDRIGGSRVSVIGIGLFVVGIAGLALPIGMPGLLLAAAVIGLGNLFVMIGQQTFVAHRARGGSSDSGFATLTTAASLGQLLGPPLVTLVATVGAASGAAPNALLGAAASAGLVLAGLTGSRRLHLVDRAAPRPQVDGSEALGMAGLARIPGLPRSLAVSAAVLVTVDLLYAYIPLWATEQDVPAVVVGLLLAIRALVSVLSRLGLARLVARVGRKALLIAAITAGVASLVALPLVGAAGAVLVMVGLGLALGIPQPLTMAWVVRITPEAVHGAALGLRMTANRLAQIALPVTIGAVTGSAGSAGVFWANAAVLASAVAVTAGADLRDDPEA
ncbi:MULTISPECIES: MFS transporter [unclassified Rathayibacter]|uniref:MFS transporter n=1 Tax=unclassified Rathayibacter TaxID=2609250 RepID=UPI0006F81CFB|nr:MULTISPECIES: MFS transporter [unclassified Rathayibacter]KQQ06184.1 hypothetical protein ASF42_06620 [Rathayibacter sp. Leaf294]KQS14040.1 hypothetical protein ASG06_06625 [Rathayibacter sp. Leaf185]